MLLQRHFFGWQGWGGISRVGGGHENSSCTLPETNFLPPKIGRANQKEFHLPTIDFVKLLVSGEGNTLNEQKKCSASHLVFASRWKRSHTFQTSRCRSWKASRIWRCQEAFDHTLEIWHRYHKLKKWWFGKCTSFHNGYLGVSILNFGGVSKYYDFIVGECQGAQWRFFQKHGRSVQNESRMISGSATKSGS